jgi:hypothetical protein
LRFRDLGAHLGKLALVLGSQETDLVLPMRLDRRLLVVNVLQLIMQ